MNKLKQAYKDNKGIMIFLTIGIVIIIILFLYRYVYLPYQYSYQEPVESFVKYTYKDNEYKPMNVTEETMAGIYYRYIKDLMINNTKELWNISDKKLKERFNNNETEFSNYIKNKITIKTEKSKIDKYSFEKDNLYIIDTEGNEYSIQEKAVWDITLTGIN